MSLTKKIGLGVTALLVVGYMIYGNGLYNVVGSKIGLIHYHDGLYASNQKILGLSYACLIDGNTLTFVQSNKQVNRIEITQFKDRIEASVNGRTEIYQRNYNGSFNLISGSVNTSLINIDVDITMVPVFYSTDFKNSEILQIMDTLYVSE